MTRTTVTLSAFFAGFAGSFIAGILIGTHPALTAAQGILLIFALLLVVARNRKIDGLVTELKMRNEELMALALTRDALEQTALEQEKLSSLGLLAAGVAHEINNPMSYILANVQVLKEVLEELPNRNEDLQEFVDSLLPSTLDGIRRVNAIVADLRKFSRGDQQEMTNYSLTEQVGAALRICSSQIKRTCATDVDLDKLCPSALGYPQRLVQVFINLLMNAAEAQPQDRQGTIEVRSGNDGNNVWVSFKDTGSGMSPEVKAKLFKPFFTTKGVGRGTGLGLAVSRNIVVQHGGRIDVESTPGCGTTFTVRLPLLPPEPAEEDARAFGHTPPRGIAA